MNKEIYKKSIDQIHAKEELKEKVFEKVTQPKVKFPYVKYITACAAMLFVIFSTGILYINNKDNFNNNQNTTDIKIAKVENDLPRFENIEQLKKVLEKNHKSERNDLSKGMITEDSAQLESSTITNSSKEKLDYSETNVQVHNVDEADIVKTDGEYIYYVSNNAIYIVKAEGLKVISKINEIGDEERFYPREIFINNDKLVVLGSGYEYEITITQETDKSKLQDSARVSSNYRTKAIVYDISDKSNPKQVREVALDGRYINSRMIGENVYFISTKSPNYFYDQVKEDEILPLYKDTAISEKENKIACTDIAYFEDTQSNNYMLVAGFNINNNDKANIETFFGASDNVYASENNLYITQCIYKDRYIYEKMENIIYKFNLNGSQIKLQCKGKVDGYLNDQFSMDEYEGNLRIATTSGYNKNSENAVYVLDENLNQIGKLENLAKGEKIYSVRFIGKVGYVVTFKQVDPLFVIDLSNPKAPNIKGQLKIPGYSSYLHPYDEKHIIGIGYNTKSNGYGGITNSSMKMSMFDVSDLENPKEMFNVSIGDNYAYSEVLNNHKALFYNKDKKLIGFPVTYREKKASSDRNGFVIYKIDLAKGFEKYGEIKQEINYKTNIDRAIYIGNTLYTLAESKIVSYDLNTISKMQEINLN